MKHIWSIICEKSSIDFETNSLSLFNNIEEINLTIDKTKASRNEKIVIPANFQIINFWVTESPEKENSTEIKAEFIDPEGENLNKFEQSLKMKKGIKRMRNRANIQGIPVTKNGRYYYRISQKKNEKFKVVAELPLDINVSYKILEKK